MAIVLIGRFRVAVRGALLSRVRFYTSRVLVVEERGTEKVTWQPIATHVAGCQSTSTAQYAFLERKKWSSETSSGNCSEPKISLAEYLQQENHTTPRQSVLHTALLPLAALAGPARHRHATGMGRHGTRGPATAWRPRSTTRTHASPTSITKQAATPQPAATAAATALSTLPKSI